MDSLVVVQVRRAVRLVVILAVVAMLLNDGIRLVSAYSRVVNATNAGRDAARDAVMRNQNSVPAVQAAMANQGATLAAYDVKWERAHRSMIARITMVARTEAPGLILLAPVYGMIGGVPASRWWSTPAVIDWTAKRTVNTQTGIVTDN